MKCLQKKRHQENGNLQNTVWESWAVFSINRILCFTLKWDSAVSLGSHWALCCAQPDLIGPPPWLHEPVRLSYQEMGRSQPRKTNINKRSLNWSRTQHRIIEHLELEGALKDHWVQMLAYGDDWHNSCIQTQQRWANTAFAFCYLLLSAWKRKNLHFQTLFSKTQMFLHSGWKQLSPSYVLHMGETPELPHQLLGFNASLVRWCSGLCCPLKFHL